MSEQWGKVFEVPRGIEEKDIENRLNKDIVTTLKEHDLIWIKRCDDNPLTITYGWKVRFEKVE